MVLPIVTYGNPILRKKCLDLDIFSCCYSKKKEINQLIKDMFETMHSMKGIGLAAPQIGKRIKLFIIEVEMMHTLDDEKKKIDRIDNSSYKEVFINARILKYYGKECNLYEGCLSIPGIMGFVKRKSNVLIEYYDQNLKKKRKIFQGICARVILHEYDHLNGKLFIDYFSSLKKKIIRKKLIKLLKKDKKIYKNTMK
ncbi:peptide deformylase [Blattabacterium cuenoti]|uniref:peptide deformylase n=1 Tax=Blattabacterium cuenoti TaxID=1653831 RepID=UPI00163C7E91|nr:peptide deformylase [Blattabacterium cuenoti]